VLAATPRTPTQFAAQEPGKVFAAINAGYFGGNQSFSLVQHAGVVASPNVKSLTRTFQGASVPYFPTRAAFGLTSSGRPTTDWIYSVGTGNTPVIAYPAPSPNRLGVAPQPVPTTASPAGGVPWIMEHAIGGSPMLIKDGEIHVTDAEELIEINNTTSRPRSAIGYTASGIVLFVAAEGDKLSRQRNGHARDGGRVAKHGDALASSLLIARVCKLNQRTFAPHLGPELGIAAPCLKDPWHDHVGLWSAILLLDRFEALIGDIHRWQSAARRSDPDDECERQNRRDAQHRHRLRPRQCTRC